jgi:glutathione S-transferase
MRLYHNQSAWTLRAHWILEEAGAAPEIVRVVLSHEAPERSAPILIDDERAIAGANAIVAHVVERFSERLSPPGSSEQAPYQRWMREIPEIADAALDAFARHTRKLSADKRSPAAAEEARRTIDGIARAIEDTLGDHPYLLGDAFTAADVMAGSAVVWMDVLGLAVGPRLAAYRDRLATRPAYERARVVMANEGAASQPWPTAVCLRPGRGAPLFFSARPNHTVGDYAALARCLETKRPIHLLQCQYPEERELGRPYKSEEFVTWARAYLTAMRAAQPEGPLFFIGLCEGVQIGYEVVRLSEARGEPVGLFGSIDTWPEENTRSPFLYRVYMVERDTRRFLELPREEQVEKVTRKLDRVLDRAFGRRRRPPAAEAPARGSPRKAAPASSARVVWEQRAFPKEAFTPRPVSSRITVFRADRQPYWRLRDRYLGWGNRTTGGVELYPIDGNHHVVLREPFVRPLARQIAICLGRLESG